MIILGIESSCDDTAAAVVSDAVQGAARILGEGTASQLAEHGPYGGIVPELAARAHILHLHRTIERSLGEAGLALRDIDAVAATAGPGLIGGLLVGLTMGKTIALALKKPLIAVNHLEGHALTARLLYDTAFPYLLLLVSGGHCQLLSVEGVGRYVRIGTTIDDAAGEAFDKTAKLLGLGFPGGPEIERIASGGNAGRFPLPRPMLGRPGCDFSFSGLKTAVRQLVDALRQRPGGLDGAAVADMAASFQAAAVASLTDRVANALSWFQERHPHANSLVAAGGVAANSALRASLARLAADRGFDLVAPPPRYCTDNAAMIGWAGLMRLRLGMIDEFSFKARPRWPLDPNARPKAYAGAKA
jgi:N6-L-threonylcarbamoyladenine synthase